MLLLSTSAYPKTSIHICIYKTILIQELVKVAISSLLDNCKIKYDT
jgi:hypothetical protein